MSQLQSKSRGQAQVQRMEKQSHLLMGHCRLQGCDYRKQRDVVISLSTITLFPTVKHIPSDGPWGDILQFIINGAAYM